MSETINYPAKMVTRARELRGAHWTCEEVANLLEREFGHRPVQSTISRWSDPRQQRTDAASNQRRSARQRAEESGGRFRALPQTPEFKLARMRGLRDEAGLKLRQIARVMAFDFGDEMTASTVARVLEENRYPKSLQ